MDSAVPMPEDGRGGAKGLLRTRRSRATALVVLVVLVVGGASFGIAQALTSGSSTPASTSPTTRAPSGVRPGVGVGVGGPGPAGRFPGLATVGTVKSIGTNSFVVTERTGLTVTVDVSSSTVYADSAATSPSFSDLKVGTEVAVTGATSSGIVHATRVTIGSFAGRGAFGGGLAPGAIGTVKSIGTNSFVVTERTGSTITVDVTSSTTYHDRGVSNPSFSDVKVGSTVFVIGSASSGTVSATSVVIGGFGGAGGGGFGGGFGGGGGGALS